MAFVGPIQDRQFNSVVSGTTYTFSPSATIAVGSLIALYIISNTAQVFSTCADNSTQAGTANSYTAEAAITGTGIKGQLIWCVATRSILSTDTITVTILGAATIRTGRMVTFTGVATTSPRDSLVQNSFAASPVSLTTAALASAGELCLLFTGWNNTAAGLSGVANSGAGFTLGAAATGTGGTTPEEVNYSSDLSVGTAAATDAHTFTSWNNMVGTIVTFLPLAAPAAFAPPAAQDSSQALERPRRYDAPRSRNVGSFDNPTVPSAAMAFIAQSRQTKPPPRVSSLSNVFDPAANSFRDWTPPALLQRAVATYRTVLSQAIPAWTPTITPDAWAALAQDGFVARYRGGPSSVAGAADQLIADTWTAVFQGRIVQLYRSPLSWASPAFTPNPTPGSDYAVVVQGNRAFPFYLAPRSSSIPVYDPATNTFADWVAQPALSRAVADFSTVRSLAINAFDNAVAAPAWAAAYGDKPVPYYLGSKPLVVPVFDQPAPGVLWAPFVVDRATALYRGGASAVAGAADQIIADSWAAVYADKPVPFYAAPRSLTLPAFTPNAPDQWAATVRGSWAAPRKLGSSSVTTAFASSAPAQGYVAVTQSRGSIARLVRTATYITADFGVLIVTQPPTGGGGEWVIWARPDFPANRAGAWRQFPTPSYRKPTRREQRGY